MPEDFQDDNLERFEATGAAPLPPAQQQDYVAHAGAQIWYASYGAGPAVLLLHGGLGHSGNWGYQVPSLVAAGYQAVLIDTRGHGRSTRDQQPYSYELLASDLFAVMDALQLQTATLVGWSDGACTALVAAATTPSRIRGVFFFACNVDPSGVKPFEATDTLSHCFRRHTKDYAELSPTPEGFKHLLNDLTPMQQTQPSYSTGDLRKIRVPIAVVQSEHEEFIKPEHAEYLARSIPNAKLILLPGVSHFAPLQRPALFNSAMLDFCGEHNITSDMTSLKSG